MISVGNNRQDSMWMQREGKRKETAIDYKLKGLIVKLMRDYQLLVVLKKRRQEEEKKRMGGRRWRKEIRIIKWERERMDKERTARVGKEGERVREEGTSRRWVKHGKPKKVNGGDRGNKKKKE